MKRKVICLLVAVLLVVFTCGCGNNNQNNQTENKKPDELAGTWKLDSVTKYTFDGSGSGSMTVSKSKYEFNYTINNDEVEIDFISEAAQDSAYEFTINESKLTLLSKDNNKGTYELTKEK